MTSKDSNIWTIDHRSRRYETSRRTKDVMIDLETAGKRPGCAILTIGATVFDPRARFTGSQQTISTENRFLARITLASCRAAGLTIDEGTMEWWKSQSPEAVEEAFGGTATLREALVELTAWLGEVSPGDNGPDVNIWSHGADFDQNILSEAYAALHMDKPWAYNAGRDTRTVFDMAGIHYKGTAHKCLDDAFAQALAVERAFSALGLTTGFEPLPQDVVQPGAA